VIVGHLGVAGAAHAARRDSSLGWLMVAAMMPDLVDGLFVLGRTCNPHGLYSHTLPAAALIAMVTGAVAYFATDRRSTGVLCVLMTLSHLPLDYITGRKLFYPGGELLGLSLYEHPAADFVLEAAMAAVGWWLVRRGRNAPRWASTWLALGALLALQGALDIAGSRGGGMKPSSCATAVALSN
jgi:hypothetical protein